MVEQYYDRKGALAYFMAATGGDLDEILKED
jgi:hypothetical protein